MANSLNRNLKVGDKVVVDGRTMVVDEPLMFGAMSFTSGSAIALRAPDSPTGSGSRFDGYDIDAAATMAQHGAGNGWAT